MTAEATDTNSTQSIETDLAEGLYLKFLELTEKAEAQRKRIDLASWCKNITDGRINVLTPLSEKLKDDRTILYSPEDIEKALIGLVGCLTGDLDNYSDFLQATHNLQEADTVKRHSHHDVHVWEWQTLLKPIIGIEVLSDNHGPFNLTWYVRVGKESKPSFFIKFFK